MSDHPRASAPQRAGFIDTRAAPSSLLACWIGEQGQKLGATSSVDQGPYPALAGWCGKSPAKGPARAIIPAVLRAQAPSVTKWNGRSFVAPLAHISSSPSSETG